MLCGALAWMAWAVYGGTYMLNKPVSRIVYNAEGEGRAGLPDALNPALRRAPADVSAPQARRAAWFLSARTASR